LLMRGIPSSRGFAAGSNVTRVRAATYSLKPDSTGAHQLVRAEAFGAAQPVLDHVVKLQFQYFGDTRPPLRPAPPEPPAIVEGWPAGESCTFALVEGRPEPRLPSLGPGDELVELPPSALTDGPWCPDAGARTRFDADLLRIRRVRFTLRVQTALASLRGPAGVLFTNGGAARAATRYVPDLEIQFDVTPRNLNLRLSP
jgi:hypothetical protein